jgi:hypothetical protein
VDLLLDVDPQIAVNDDQQPVTWGRTRTRGLTLLNVGSQEQAELQRAGDRIRIDWGYFHLVVPDDQQAAMAMSYASLGEFAKSGNLPAEDVLQCRNRRCGDRIQCIWRQRFILGRLESGLWSGMCCCRTPKAMRSNTSAAGCGPSGSATA